MIMTILTIWLLVWFSVLTIMIPLIGYAALFFALSFIISIFSFLSPFSIKQYAISNLILYIVMTIHCFVVPFFQHEAFLMLTMWMPCSLLLIPLIRAQKGRVKGDKYDIFLFAVSLTPGMLITLFSVIKATSI